MKNKVVVITGASAGIGAALAEALAPRGASLVLMARQEAALSALATKLGPAAHAAPGDVTRRQDIERVVATAIGRFGRIDVWVNNAGRGISRLVSELTDEDFDEMMLVNAKSALYGMQAVLPTMKAQGSGHIINVSSLLGRVPFAPQRSAYSASKHALNALSANLRMELSMAHPNIHVSVVHPGVVATDFGKNALHGGVDSRVLPGAQPVEEVAAVIAQVIEQPRADVYTRPEAQKMIVSYYAAEDLGAREKEMAMPLRRPS